MVNTPDKKLLPCPFCGCEPEPIKYEATTEYFNDFWKEYKVRPASYNITCRSAEKNNWQKHLVSVTKSTEADAITAWNTRTTPNNAELVAALEELLSAHHNLYKCEFGEDSDPTIDIAAKPARAILQALSKIPKINSFDVYKKEMAERENAAIDEAEKAFNTAPQGNKMGGE